MFLRLNDNCKLCFRMTDLHEVDSFYLAASDLEIELGSGEKYYVPIICQVSLKTSY